MSGLPAATTVVVLDAVGRVVVQTTTDAVGTAQLALPVGLVSGWRRACTWYVLVSRFCV